jgi:hypothetical protein
MEKETKSILQVTCVSAFRHRMQPIRIVISFGGQEKWFGNYYDEQEAMAALLRKLEGLNEVGLLELVTRAEVVFDNDDPVMP